MEQRAINKLFRKKWKHVKGMENVASEHNRTLHLEAAQYCRKRQWQLCDEVEEQCPIGGSCKKQERAERESNGGGRTGGGSQRKMSSIE